MEDSSSSDMSRRRRKQKKHLKDELKKSKKKKKRKEKEKDKKKKRRKSDKETRDKGPVQLSKVLTHSAESVNNAWCYACLLIESVAARLNSLANGSHLSVNLTDICDSILCYNGCRDYLRNCLNDVPCSNSRS